MESKTIKISKETYLWLLGLAAELQKQHHRPVTFDYALNTLINEKMKKKSIKDFAGVWKDMSDKDAEEIKNNIKKLRKKSTRDLIENDIYRF